MKKAVITGGTGLVGSHLVAELIASGDYQITLLIRSRSTLEKLDYTLSRRGLKSKGLKIIETELTDFEAISSEVDGVDVVFHCAALVNLDNAFPEKIITNNVEITSNVAQACLRATHKPLLVHVSSIAALGEAPYPGMTTESTIFENIATASAYSQSKFLSENEVWRAAAMGLRVVIVNPSVILGRVLEGRDGGLQQVLRVARRGIPFYTAGQTGYVDVRDVARAMRLLVEEPESWGARYIISGMNLTYRDLITALNQSFGKPRPWISLGRRTLELMIAIMGIVMREPLISRSMVGFLTNRTLYDGSLIERSIPNFHYHSLDETLNDMRD